MDMKVILLQTADGAAGIAQATTMVASYFAVACSLLYAVSAVLGLIGAVRVFIKWNHGDHDVAKAAASWFGSCIFVAVVATVLKSFFGV